VKNTQAHNESNVMGFADFIRYNPRVFGGATNCRSPKTQINWQVQAEIVFG
jgi:hypothetical protein